MSILNLDFEPQGLAPLETNVPAFDTVTLTNVKATVALFDASTQERLNGKFSVPDDIDASGTVTFRMQGYSVTAAASKNVAFDFEHAAVANDEDLDSASYTTESSGDKATINNQNDLEHHEWTETVTNLGWADADTVFFKLSRKAASANNLTGDWAMLLFTIEIPLA
jgi:hypothetical protein